MLDEPFVGDLEDLRACNLFCIFGQVFNVNGSFKYPINRELLKHSMAVIALGIPDAVFNAHLLGAYMWTNGDRTFISKEDNAGQVVIQPVNWPEEEGAPTYWEDK